MEARYGIRYGSQGIQTDLLQCPLHTSWSCLEDTVKQLITAPHTAPATS